MTRSVLVALVGWADEAAPQEACGLLLGTGDTVREATRSANAAADPLRFFEIEPAALIAAHRTARDGGPHIVGYWHSHPSGAAAPSAEDRRQAARDGRVWAIVAGGTVAFWRDGHQGFVELSYSLADG